MGATETHGASTLEPVILIIVLLLVASLTLPAVRKLNFPHSVFLVLAGLLVGYYATGSSGSSASGGWFSEITTSLANFQLSSETILFIFLPTLIFESAYKINARELIKDLPSILTLAVPALLISIFTVGFALHYLGGMALPLALLFGTLISATDPVAVIAIFKELGAPKRLELLVEGESLFNDATSIVIFGIILGFIEAGGKITVTAGILTGVGSFFVVFFGGALVGLTLGVIFSSILGTVKTMPAVEIILTTILAYLSFIVAEHYLHVSGVMSTVSAGVLLGSWGRTKISLEVHEFMENFWETLSFSANSILFFCIGLLLTHYLAAEVLLKHLPLFIIAIIAVNAGRAAAVFSLLPVMSSFRFTERISPQYQTVIWWGGGLRGAIAIALVLSLIGSSLSQSEQQTIFLLTFVVVIFTLLANALSIGKVISALGLDRLGTDELYSQKMAVLHTKTKALETAKTLMAKAKLYPGIYMKVIEGYEGQRRELGEELTSLSEMTLTEKADVLTRDVLLIEKNAYLEAFAGGEISETSMKDLQAEVDRELDRLKAGRPLFAEREQFERRSWLEMLAEPFEKVLHTYTTNTLAMRYEKAKATKTAVETIIGYLETKGKEVSELRHTTESLYEKYVSLMANAIEEMADIAVSFPEYVDTVVERVLQTHCLTVEQKEIRKMHELGQLTDMAFKELDDSIEERFEVLGASAIEKIGLDPVKLLSQVSFFSSLDEIHLERLASHLKTKPFLKGDMLITEGNVGGEMLIITRGVVQVFSEKIESPILIATLKSGDILGEMALISSKARNASAQALSHGSALVLAKNHFEDFLGENPDVKKKVYEVYHERE